MPDRAFGTSPFAGFVPIVIEPGVVYRPFALTTQTVACIVAQGYRTGAHPVADSEACRTSSRGFESLSRDPLSQCDIYRPDFLYVVFANERLFVGSNERGASNESSMTDRRLGTPAPRFIVIDRKITFCPSVTNHAGNAWEANGLGKGVCPRDYPPPGWKPSGRGSRPVSAPQSSRQSMKI